MTAPRVRRLLAVAAAIGGTLALFAGSPYRGGNGQIDVQALATAVARGDDHVDPVELARWIKDRRPRLRVLDLRSTEEFDTYHIPRAERIDLTALAATSFRPDETLVLCSAGGTHAAQAWVFLRALGHRQVYVLLGGVDAWLAEVMNPTMAPDASPQEKAAFQGVAEVSRYFGGVPRVGAPRAPADSAAARVRRRGC